MRLVELTLFGLLLGASPLLGTPPSGTPHPDGGVSAPAEVKDGLRLEVPYFAQVKEGCGSASIAMLLGYWRAHGHSFAPETLDPALIHTQVYSAKDRGSKATDVERFLRTAGMSTFAIKGQWSDLTEHIGEGRPLLAALRAPGGRGLHYVVITGVSPGHVLLHDPAANPSSLWSRRDFEKRWKASGNWTLLALPAQ